MDIVLPPWRNITRGKDNVRDVGDKPEHIQEIFWPHAI